mmetsp:Transcript_57906/g.155083  ORF Transcript_57906/g.155083 Transcript_57906/m.155083 type:complete len:214 (-) Transcript_57906:1273-1914(-)
MREKAHGRPPLPSSVEGQVVEACHHGLEQLYVAHARQVRARQHKENRPLYVLDVEGVAKLAHGLLHLLAADRALVRDVAELLEYPGQEVVLLVDDFANGTGSSSHLCRLRPLDRLCARLLDVALVMYGVQPGLLLHHVVMVVLFQEGVAELVVTDLAVPPGVEVAHYLHDLIVVQVEAKLLQGPLELGMRHDTIVVVVKAPEYVAHQGVLLAH